MSPVVGMRAMYAVLTALLVLEVSLVASAHPEKRIINGKEAAPNAHPSLVTVITKTAGATDGSVILCGGALVRGSWVLTAAHCVDSAVDRPSEVILLFGNHALQGHDEGELRSSAKKIILHPQWQIGGTEGRAYDDIALVKLESPPELVKNKIEVAQMADDGEDFYAGKTCTQAGWGKTGTSGHSEILQEHDVVILNGRNKQEEYLCSELDARMLCAKSVDEWSSHCSGDSGSPLMCDGKVVGVVQSTVIGCPLYYPFWLGSVATYKPWIEATMDLDTYYY